MRFREHVRLLRTYLGPQWRQAAALAAFLLLGIAMQLLNPQLLRAFIDRATTGAPLASLLALAAAFVGVALVAETAGTLTAYVSERLGWTATNRLRGDLALHVLGLDLSFHHSRTPGELIERVDGDVTQLATFFSHFVVRVLGNTLLLLGVLVLVFREDWRAGLGFVAFTVAAVAAFRWAFDLAVPHWKASRQAGAALLGFLGERLAGTEDIRANGAEGHALRRLYEAMREQMLTTRRAWMRGQVMWGSTIVLFALGQVLAFTLGASLLARGSITIGGVFLLLYYIQMVYQPLEQITRQMQELQRATASVGRIAEMFAVRPVVQDGPGTPLPSGALGAEFAHVSFAYGDENVLHDLSLALAPGRVLGLLGRTGSGKSTVARLLARLYDPGDGVVRVGGVDLRATRLDDLRARVALVTQDVQVFHATLRDNLTLFDRAIPDEAVRAALEEVGLGAWLAALPSGLDTPVASSGLSAGEAQLLAFARVLLRDPGLVVLDEASSRLDPATEQRIERALARLLRDRTAVIIAHRLHTVQRADEILILDGGRVLEHGPREQLARDPRSRFAHLLQAGLEEVLA